MMRFHPKTHFRIENPGERRPFRIRYKSPETGSKWKTLKLPEIDNANKWYKVGAVSFEHTKKKMEGILKQLYKERDKFVKKPEFMSENIALVEKMWNEKYTRRKQKQMKRPENSWRDLVLAAESAGMFPLDTCDLDELGDYLDKTLGHNQNRLRRRIVWLNSILSWLGRPKISQNQSRLREKVTYLNEKEFKQVSQVLPRDMDRTIARIAFYTGLRIGEIFGLDRSSIRNEKSLVVDKQMLELKSPDGSYRFDSTKTNSSRFVFYPSWIKEDLESWINTPLSERYKIRQRRYSSIIKNACIKCFGTDNPVKLLNFHGLRHSHAVWFLQNGASLNEVAQQLGNHAEVTFRYYSGFELKIESIDRLERLVEEKRKKDEPEKHLPSTSSITNEFSYTATFSYPSLGFDNPNP
ncbi:MAG: site-specific integrase [Pseudobacteriovorax sp.]|nr:site-specific integrase [Pseudobacteriovorax sp.]